MWIIHYKNGLTINEKMGIDYLKIDHADVVSAQILFNGTYYTVTRANDSQRIIQLKSGLSMQKMSGLHFDIKLAKRLLFCVYNQEGDAMGWEVDYITNKAYKISFNTKDMKLNNELFDLDYNKVVFGTPKLESYRMKSF